MGNKHLQRKWKGKNHKGHRPKHNKKNVKERKRLRLLAQDVLLNEYFNSQQKAQ